MIEVTITYLGDSSYIKANRGNEIMTISPTGPPGSFNPPDIKPHASKQPAAPPI